MSTEINKKLTFLFKIQQIGNKTTGKQKKQGLKSNLALFKYICYAAL
ncbi:MAG: hypothetical protein L3J52_03290 [Proteobacteria bacterium]|nr:hypothetical protein [Pseudomonadota bacterium]